MFTISYIHDIGRTIFISIATTALKKFSISMLYMPISLLIRSAYYFVARELL